MGYFPMFVNLQGASVLVIGGGRVALRKTRSLLPFGPKIRVVAPAIAPEFEDLLVTLEHRPFSPEDLLESPAMVICASGEEGVNRQAALLCRERNIPVNDASQPEEGSFLFPAIAAKGNMTVGICAGGCPGASQWMREQVETLLPDCLPEILDWLTDIRPGLLETIPEKARARTMKQLFLKALEERKPLSDGEIALITGRTAEKNT